MIVQNQIGGWGLSNAELAEATATADQVFKGKTFFAGDDILKTGAFDLSLANATAAQVLSGYKFYAGNSTLKTGTLVVPSGTYRLSAGRFNTPNIHSSGSVNCGFRPTHLALWRGDPDPDRGIAIIYDVNSSSGDDGNIGYWSVTITITSSGFEYEDLYNTSSSCYYFAFGK